MFDKGGARLAGWTYVAKGRAVTGEGSGGIDRWGFSCDDASEQVKVAAPLGHTATYERKRGLDGVRKQISLDLHEIFAPSSTSRKRSSGLAPKGSQ